MKSKTPIQGFPPRPSFKIRASTSEGENIVLLTPEASSKRVVPEVENKLSYLRSYSLKKVLAAFSANKSSSLPVTRDAKLSPSTSQSTHGVKAADQPPAVVHAAGGNFSRSLSAPSNNKKKSLRRTDSAGGVILVKPITPRVIEAGGVATPREISAVDSGIEDDTQEIPEEEAVCRICMVELCEGGQTLKMECSCKGELALAHEECAVKWFTIKGNKICDVCRQEVQNLPVTLMLRTQSVENDIRQPARRFQNQQVQQYRFWQDIPILAMISTLAYFCFLEQLLVNDLKAGALAIALPFACILGLLAALTASFLVNKDFIWAYASFQFAFVILFSHIFYSVIQINAVLAIILASFAGFGVAMGTNSLIIEFWIWRARSRVRSNVSQNNQMRHTLQNESTDYLQNDGQQQAAPDSHADFASLAASHNNPLLSSQRSNS
ncbi:uncharacterized protein LOC131061007 isoform X2 [Cryptomeria japonica]|nr:uncharacterized protein LOC131061007 isoform X2 [Cryptomeria japonica]